MTPPTRDRRPRRPPPPLDAAALQALALAYVGRYATSRASLIRYLARKLRERGAAEGERPDPEAIADRFVGLGYVDDAAIADARGRALGRRGFGAGRVRAALGVLGIAEHDGADAIETARGEGWERALRFAERRRIGPYAGEIADEAGRRRAFAAMMRAGHAPHHVRRIVDAPPGDVPARDE